MMECSGVGGVSWPRPRKLSMVSCIDLRRIHSSWRNRISSHGAEPGPQPYPSKSIIFFIPQKKKKENEVEGGESGGVEDLEGRSKREAVCMGVQALGELRKETTGG